MQPLFPWRSFRIWNWNIKRDIVVSAQYLPGCEKYADALSRQFADSTEWMLKQYILENLQTIFLSRCRSVCFSYL